MPWFKVDDGLHAHRKVIRAGIPAMGLWVVAGSWCADQLTDGFIPDYVAQRLDPNFAENAAALVAAKLWIPGEKDDETGWWFHQWAEEGRQPSAAAVTAKRDDARERMAKLRAERAEAAKNKEERSQDVRANESTTSREVASTPTRPDPTHTSVPNGTEEDLWPGTATPPPDDSPAAKPKRGRKKPVTNPKERPDVEALCNRLVELMKDRGCRTKPISDAWRTEARLLLDKDGVHFQFAMDVLEWSQKSSFWKTNILSMPKFREKWDTLQQQAQRECGRHPNSGQPATAPAAETVTFGDNVVAIRPGGNPAASDLGGDAHMSRYLARAAARRAAGA